MLYTPCWNVWKPGDAVKSTRSLNEHFNFVLSAVNRCLSNSMRSIAKNDLKGPMTAQECFNSFWRAGKRKLDKITLIV